MEVAWNALRELIDPVRRRHIGDAIRALAAVSLPRKRAPRLSRIRNGIESVLNKRLRDNDRATREYQWS